MSGIFLNILLSINMFKYLLDLSHVLHLCKKQVFQLLHCGAVWPVYPATKTYYTRKKMHSENMVGWKQVSPPQSSILKGTEIWYCQANPNHLNLNKFKHRALECWWFLWSFMKIIYEFVGYIYPDYLVDCLIKPSNLRRVASDLYQLTMKPSVSHKLYDI